MRKSRSAAGRLGSRLAACLVGAAAGVATLALPAQATPHVPQTGLSDGMMPANSPDAVTTHVATSSTAGRQGPVAADTQAAAAAVPLGVDVSSHQHPAGAAIDWAKVAGKGQKFAVVKATELYTDDSTGLPVAYTNPYLATDVAAAHANGLVVGTYAFARPQNSAIDQADNYAAALAALPGGGLPAGSLPPVLDLEVTGDLGVSALRTWTHTFLSRLQADTGELPMIYTGPNFWATAMGGTSDFSQYPLWEAHYTTAAQPYQIGGWKTYTLWQFTSSATLSGITGPVDQDRFNTATGATLTNLHRPTGSFEGATADATGLLSVAGWTIDPDTPTTPTRVAFSLDGNWATALADGTRTDVGARYPLAGAQHGFYRQFRVGVGSHRVCAYALDNSSSSVRTGLGCASATVTPHLPTGSLEGARVDGTGALTVTGWTLDPDTPTTPTNVLVTVDGQASTVLANGTRADVGAYYPTAGTQHGFSTQSQLTLGTHQVCAYAVDTSFPDLHTGLRCLTVTVTPGRPFGSMDGAHVVSGILTVTGWAIDPDTLTTPTSIAILLDGNWATTLANGTRTDVGTRYPDAGAQHGFGRQFRVGAGSHRVCAYAVDTSFPSLHTGLRCVTTT